MLHIMCQPKAQALPFHLLDMSWHAWPSLPVGAANSHESKETKATVTGKGKAGSSQKSQLTRSPCDGLSYEPKR